jgi:hypothetical protein
MLAHAYWKDEIEDLTARAAEVTASIDESKMSARTAARCLSGICGLVARRWTVDEMQRTCAELVRHERAWATSFGDLPHVNGIVHERTQLVVVVARALLPLAGPANVRSALSFWATESDPAVWAAVAG